MIDGAGEYPSSEEAELQRAPISLYDFNGALLEYLEGTMMLNVLARIEFELDPEGNVAPQVIDNLKTMLKKSSEMTPDEEARMKFDNMRGFLAPY